MKKDKQNIEKNKCLTTQKKQALFAHELPKEVVEKLGTVDVSEECSKFNDEYKP